MLWVSLLLVGVVALYAFFIVMVMFFSSKKEGDSFSPFKVLCYFSIIELMVMGWFSLDIWFVERSLFKGLDGKYQQYDLLVFSYVFSVLIFSFKLLGVFLGMQGGVRASAGSKVFKRVSQLDELGSEAGWRKFLLIYLAAIVMYLVFLNKIGGLSAIWENLNFRSTMTAGYGFLSIPYAIFIVLSAASLFSLFIKRRPIVACCFVIAAGLCLVSLGQRSPLAFLIFAVLIMYHYKVKEIKVASVKIVVVMMMLLVFLFAFGKARNPDGYSEGSSAVQVIEQSVIKRLAALERQIVVVGYFQDEEYWGLGLYKSLIYMFVPRSLYLDKPPMDTGVYLKEISEGGKVNPPVAANAVSITSWPDGYLAGYMSFGYLGLILVCVSSGFLFGRVYRMMLKSGCREGYVYLYAYVGYLGILPLSPLGVARIFYVLIMLSMLGWFFLIVKNFKRGLGAR